MGGRWTGHSLIPLPPRYEADYPGNTFIQPGGERLGKRQLSFLSSSGWVIDVYQDYSFSKEFISNILYICIMNYRCVYIDFVLISFNTVYISGYISLMCLRNL